MVARRLVPAAPADTGRAVRFSFDGDELIGREGEPLAASLLVAGRPVLSRSFRFHRPRGLMCSTGQCGWCECEVDGVPSVRTCRVPLRAGLVARGEHALPSVRLDLLALVGSVSRWIPPTFYHHRFLRPRRLRKRYLDVLRWFGGRGRLRLDQGRSVPVPRPLRRIETDVVVVGGGPAGLLAAVSAAKAGARVVLVEAEPELGSGWRWRADRSTALAALSAAIAAHGIDVHLGTTAVAVHGPELTLVAPDGVEVVTAGAVVAATGSYELLPTVPGIDLPGVMGARTVEWLIAAHGILPGERAVLVGSAANVAAAGDGLARGGASSIGPIAPETIVRVEGRTHVRGILHRAGRAARREAADLIVVGSRAPSLELVLAAGATLGRSGGIVTPLVDDDGATDVPWLFVAGSAAGRPVDGPDGPGAAAARLAGGRAAATARGRGRLRSTLRGASRRTVPAAEPAGLPAGDAAAAGQALACFCEDVHVRELRAEVAAGYGDPELVKRRTGALTGPCQGKYCQQAFDVVLRSSGPAAPGSPDVPAPMPPTGRPPLRPIRLADLAVDPPRDAATLG